jgi:DNA-binding NarL/FixJ family response regulator
MPMADAMMVDTQIRVLCVDDNPLVADAVATRLTLAGGFRWLGHLTGAEGLGDAVARERPDVILMDLDMPGEDPFEAIRVLSATQPDVRVLILSGHVRSELIDRAIEAGAWGYLSKSDGVDTLVSAIERVAAGEFVLGPEVATESTRR